MTITLTIIFALFGAALGSFLNVCIDRLPAGKSIIHQQSHCDNCQRKLNPLEMVPVISYLALRGRCRKCRAKIPLRVLWVEILFAVITAYLFIKYGLSLQLAIGIYYGALYVLIAFIDLEHRLILNRVIYPALVISLVINLFFPVEIITGSIFGNTTLLKEIVHSGAALNGIIGGATGFFLLMLIALVSRGGMAFGDVKMATLIGMTVGFPQVITALIIAAVAGGLVAVILVSLRLKKRKDAIPFGPFLSMGTLLALIWGKEIVTWYLGFFQG